MDVHNFSKVGRYDENIKKHTSQENTMALLKLITPGISPETSVNSTLQPAMAKCLTELNPDGEGFIFSIDLDVSLKRELEGLGVIPNTLVEMICRDESTVIIQVDHRRVVLDSDTASHIKVHPINS